MATIPAPEGFNFEELLLATMEYQLSLEDTDAELTDLDGEDGDLFSLSPLSSPGTSPTRPPTNPSVGLPSTSELPSAPPLSAAALKKRKSHAHRRRKRTAAKANLTPSDYEPRLSTRRKYAAASEGIQTELKGEDMRIASTGYVGIRGSRSSAVYSLRQLVGPGSRFGFDLVEWDGR